MNASFVGNHALNPLQALARLLSADKPSHSSTPRKRKPCSIQFIASETGITAYLNASPVAWIVPGYHQETTHNTAKRCDFVDVAYHRQTKHGVNLETADFLTLDEATAFIAKVFGGAK